MKYLPSIAAFALTLSFTSAKADIVYDLFSDSYGGQVGLQFDNTQDLLSLNSQGGLIFNGYINETGEMSFTEYDRLYARGLNGLTYWQDGNADTLGTSVDSTLNWQTGSQISFPGITDSPDEQYFGFRVGSNGTDFNYGWVGITIQESSNEDETTDQINIHEAAIDTTLNQPIAVGQTSAVPEPSAFLFSGLGTIALFAVRRRKS